MPQPYRLRVAFGAEGIEGADCSCPVGSRGRCKHVGGLLLAWLDRPDAFRAVPELDADLERRGKDELIALIKRMLRLQPDLETLLEAPLPGDDRRGAPVDPETYRRQVSSAFRRGGNDWMAHRRIADDVDGIVDAGDDFLALDDPASASVVYRAVAREILEHYDPGYDEDGNLGDVVDRCVEGLGDCLAGGDDDVGREQTLQVLFEIYRFELDCGGIGLGEAAPVLILEHATNQERRAIAGWVRAAMRKDDDRNDDFHRQAHGRFLLELESADLDDDAFLNICRESGLLAELVDRLLTLGRLDEAVSEAERAGDYQLLILADVFLRHGCAPRVEPLLVGRIETSQDHRLTEWLKARHRERGELAEALTLARRLLQARPHLAGYQEVRELSRQLGVWRELRPDLIGEWSAAGWHDLLTDIHLEEGEIDLALRSVRQRQSRFPHQADRLIHVAQAASETHPHAAADIYLQQAEILIEARGRDNYRRACDHLVRVRDIHRQLGEEPAWSDLIARLRERHRRLPALREELSNSGL